MPPHKQFRIAIIGTGGIAHAHADAIRQLSTRARLVAVADVDSSRAATFAAEFGVPATYSNATELLAGEQLDLVCVCTPPATHASLASAALRAGVPALVEKPTVLSLSEIDELAAVQAETGVPVLTVFQHRFGQAAVRLRHLANSGALGRPLVASCQTLWYRDADYFQVPWRGRWEVEGGGPTMGHGIHQFDLLLSILGPWSQVSAFAARQARITDTEDVSVAVARFDNGTLATVTNSVVSPRETSKLRIDYEYATVELEHLYGYEEKHWKFTPAPGHEDLAEQWLDPRAEEGPSAHRSQFDAIFDALDEGTEPGTSLTDARRTLEFAAATYASAFRGHPIAAGEISEDDPFALSMDGGMLPWDRVKEAGA